MRRRSTERHGRCPYCGRRIRNKLDNFFGGRCTSCNNRYYTRFVWPLLFVLVLSPLTIHFVLKFDIILDIAIFSIEIIALGIYALIGTFYGFVKHRTDPYGTLADIPQIYSAKHNCKLRFQKGEILITDAKFDEGEITSAPICVLSEKNGKLRFYFLYDNEQTQEAINSGIVDVYLPLEADAGFSSCQLVIDKGRQSVEGL